MSTTLPDGLIAYGSDANCTLEICQVEWSVLQYRPSRPANGTFIGLFGIALIIHAIRGTQLRDWGYMGCMVLGCICEITGYAGRIMLWYNPFSFVGFMIEIICITIAPVFYCAPIYVTLSQAINFLDPTISRFKPKLLYWVFIPFDIFSLILQAAGGAISSVSDSSDDSQVGVDISLAGLSLQVFTLFLFTSIAADYLIRYFRLPKRPGTSSQFKVFLCSLSLAIILILVRCAYRIEELKDGYSGESFHDEWLFVGLESVVISIAIFCLCFSYPSYGLTTNDCDYDTRSEQKEISSGNSSDSSV